MILRDFRCPSSQCGKTFESLTDPWDPVRCPECCTHPCEKLFSAPKVSTLNRAKEAKRDRVAEMTKRQIEDC